VAGFREQPGRLALRTAIINWATAQLTPDFEAGIHERLFAAAEKHQVPLVVFASGQLRPWWASPPTIPS
jgi:hypothetical protein